MFYLATHATRYRYEASVAHSLSETRLVPRSHAGQKLHQHELEIHPEPANVEQRIDYFGNQVASISIFRSHTEFSVTATSVVELLDATPEKGPPAPWEQVHDRMRAPEAEEDIRASEFLHDSPHVQADPLLAAFARTCFPPHQDVREGARELCSRIHREFRYQPDSTSIDTPVLEVLERRAGVCQDFAHLMIGALRSLGLPARYVSGYLRSGANYQGAEASHAWVSVYVPGSGWLDFDPTNNVAPALAHVTLAWGRDYSDVPPTKGVSLGGGRQTVEVEVRVRPVHPSEIRLPMDGGSAPSASSQAGFRR